MIDSKRAYTTIKKFLKLHPVRPEKTGERPLEMSAWFKQHCRPSKSGCVLDGIELGAYNVFDIDFILYDYERKMFQLLEVKTRNGKVRYAQDETLCMLDSVCRAGAELANTKYIGKHILIMDGTTPSNSKHMTWDGKPVDREKCWRLINMLDKLG